MKKVMFMILSLMLVGAVLASCSKKAETTPAASNAAGTTAPTATAAPVGPNLNLTDYPIVKEPITLKAMGITYAIVGPWDKLKVYTEAEKKTNIHLQWDMAEATDYPTKENLAVASGSLPDIFFNSGLTKTNEIKYGSQGIIIPLEDLIDKYMPNLKADMEADPTIKPLLTSADGHIYSFPSLRSVASHADYGARINPNMAVLSKYGITTMPTTTDELYADLQKVHKGDPTIFPLTGSNLNEMRTSMLSPFGLIEDGNGIMVQDGKVIFVPTQDNYKAYLTYMNKLYSENLLDHEVFTQTAQQYIAKGKANKLAFFTTAGPESFLPITADEIIAQKMPIVPPMTSPVNSKKIWPYVGTPNATGMMAITKADKNPEATARWADYWYSPEGTLLDGLGITMTPEQWADPKYIVDGLSAVPAGTKDVLGYFYLNLSAQKGPMGGKVSEPEADHIIDGGQSQIWKYMTNQTLTILAPYAQTPYPQVHLTVEESQKLTTIQTDINTYKDQMEAKFIAGQEPLSNWDTYVSTFNKMKVDQELQIFQAAYDRYQQASN